MRCNGYGIHQALYVVYSDPQNAAGCKQMKSVIVGPVYSLKALKKSCVTTTADQGGKN